MNDYNGNIMAGQSLVSDRPPMLSVLIICVLVFVGFTIVGPLLGLLVSSFFSEGNLLQALQDPIGHPELQPVFFITQAFASGFGLIALPLGYISLVERKPLSPFYDRTVNWVIVIPLIVILAINFIVAISPIIEWNSTVHFPSFLEGFEDWARKREDYAAEVTSVFTTFNSTGAFLTGLLVVAILPGIGEELVFRGLLQNEFMRATRNPHVAIWIAAFLFSAIHLQFFGFIPRLLLGALFGYLYYWSGTLLVPTIAHIFHNGFTLSMMYLYQLRMTDINVDTEESAPWGGVIIAAAITAALLFFFRRMNIKDQTNGAL